MPTAKKDETEKIVTQKVETNKENPDIKPDPSNPTGEVKVIKDLPKTPLKAAHQEELRQAMRVARRSVFLLIALTIAKGVAGYITNFIPLIGDAVSSFSDILAAIAIFMGLRLSTKRAGHGFSYGYHRIETLISFLISLFILVIGGRLFLESINSIFTARITTNHIFGIIISSISIIAAGYSYYNQKAAGEKLESKAMLASAYDKRNDMFVSGGVLLGIVGDKFGIAHAGAILGILISVLIIWSGVKFAKESLLDLLDFWDDPKIARKIRTLLKKSRIVTKIKKIRLRKTGTFLFGEAILETNPFSNAIDLRNEIHRLHHSIEENIRHLGDFVLYIDAPKPDKIRVAIPVQNPADGLSAKIDIDDDSDYTFLFVDIKDGQVHDHFHLAESFHSDDAVKMAEFLQKNKTNIYITNSVEPLLYYNLRLNNIKVYPKFVGIDDVHETIKLLILDI
ncbi:hypothetical protein COV82_00705 [Candidatus Peregrinibacteria bacterium CG11_big_fil_rev_8_21_14_0_20_46_8]|nr:MAG: hypothetical protein COV82_00705 [Candidatus Peregrinibacteria bacterium CG11_big_fil_rev_8_21_14_0_20_46_8]